MLKTCEGCIETKDKPLTYAKCEKCEGWREFSDQEKEKMACLDENGRIIPGKWGAYRKKYGRN